MSRGSEPHITVLHKEAVENLNPRPGGRYVDGTLGAGGHSRGILEAYQDTEVLGIDRDEEALEVARKNLAEYGSRTYLVRGGFDEMTDFAADIGWNEVDGVLLDIGVSSMQIDTPLRGFSYRFDGPLDMRMDKRSPITASVVLNESTLSELTRIFRVYGEEKRARKLAEAIVARRERRPWIKTGELAELIRDVTTVGRKPRRNAVGRCFQALRIEVNDELGQLERALDEAIELLAIGGRIAVISFHSLEDRIVKRKFVDEATECICPPGMPVCRCDKVARLKILTRKPIVPNADEIKRNKRASSAKLRVAEKVAEG